MYLTVRLKVTVNLKYLLLEVLRDLGQVLVAVIKACIAFRITSNTDGYFIYKKMEDN